MVMHPAFYNGLRHFVFVVPPFAVLGGLAAAYAFDRVRAYGMAARGALAALFIGGVTLPVIDMVRLHPYQYTAFNWASGGVRMAHDNYMLDYWGLSFKQASEALHTRLDAMRLKPPPGRRWIVEICGPQRGAEVALGDRIRNHLGPQARGFRDDARHVLLPRPESAGAGRNRARRRGLRTRLRLRGGPTPNLLTEPPP